MLVFGFAAGLPYTLLIGTLNAWLGEWEIDLATIGVLSWIGLAYAFKFLWSPLVDRVRLPGLERLGRRRSWLIVCQVLLTGTFFALVRVRPAPAARLVRAGRGDRRLRLGDSGRGHRRLAHRRRRRAGAGRNPLLHLPVRLPHRGADRRRAGAGAVGAGQLADGLCDHGRLHGADRHRHPARAGHAARGGRARAQRASPAPARSNRGCARSAWRSSALGWLWAIWTVGILHGAGPRPRRPTIPTRRWSAISPRRWAR